MSLIEHSCLYTGQVRHRRFMPVEHAFRYRLFMVYLDLSELPDCLAPFPLWSARRPALAWFRRADYHRPAAGPLAAAVRDTLAGQLGWRPAGPIRLLTHCRYWGYVFNPVSFYYCFDQQDGKLEAILAEITNTPWGERHCYALDCRDQPRRGEFCHFEFDKAFHVSPFNPMDMHYQWHFRPPGERLDVHMVNLRQGQKVFDAGLHLRRRALTTPAMLQVLAAYPLMTAKVVAAIHWQALRLWHKKAPFHAHP